MIDVSGSGDRLYRIPAQNEIVEATIQKLDDSGNVLTVTFYNNGVAAQTGKISSPHGTLDIHADMRLTAPATTATVTTK
jgi:Trk K+ transport system NAD-binding subunit